MSQEMCFSASNVQGVGIAVHGESLCASLCKQCSDLGSCTGAPPTTESPSQGTCVPSQGHRWWEPTAQPIFRCYSPQIPCSRKLQGSSALRSKGCRQLGIHLPQQCRELSPRELLRHRIITWPSSKPRTPPNTFWLERPKRKLNG